MTESEKLTIALFERQVRYLLQHNEDIVALQQQSGGGGGAPIETAPSPMAGKAVACVGDSITADGSYVNPLKTMLGAASMLNAGTGGQAYTGGFFEGTISGLPTTLDLVVLAGGVNDFRGDRPLGTLADCCIGDSVASDAAISNASFYGAFYRAIYAALTRLPNAKICVVTPYNNPESVYGAQYPKYNKLNGVGAVLADYVEAMKRVAGMFGVPVADVNGESGINFATDKKYLTDGIHAGAAGGQLMARVIADRIVHTPYFGA